MDRHVPIGPCEGNHNGQAGRAMVENIGGDDNNGSVTGLLMTPGRVQINEPHFAARGGLGQLGLIQAVIERDVPGSALLKFLGPDIWSHAHGGIGSIRPLQY